MKFAHLADIHIGGWQDQKLRKLNLNAFDKAINICINENTAFILIAGDFFNTALPSIDSLKDVARILRKVKEKNISLYLVPGSHDFSPSGKSMIDVLEKAGLLKNVMKIKDNKLLFTEDKTGTKITGILGLRTGLEKEYFKTLNFKDIEEEEGFKIFIFHTSIEEYKPKDLGDINSLSLDLFPKNFDYYAGGHVHYLLDVKHDRGHLAYPGPLFPNNFKELEELKKGCFNLIETKDDMNIIVKKIPIKLKEIDSYFFDANGRSPLQIENEILNAVKNFKDKIVMIRIEGILETGKPTDINFKNIFDNFKEAYVVLKNTNKLVSKSFDNIRIDESIELTESRIIEEHVKSIELKNPEVYNSIIKSLLLFLDSEKEEGEKSMDFERRIMDETLKSLGIENLFKNDNQ